MEPTRKPGKPRSFERLEMTWTRLEREEEKRLSERRGSITLRKGWPEEVVAA